MKTVDKFTLTPKNKPDLFALGGGTTHNVHVIY